MGGYDPTENTNMATLIYLLLGFIVVFVYSTLIYGLSGSGVMDYREDNVCIRNEVKTTTTTTTTTIVGKIRYVIYKTTNCII